jgi:VIT1/CCC1 family predicted Fe2+/Mn2+ transporter
MSPDRDPKSSRLASALNKLLPATFTYTKWEKAARKPFWEYLPPEQITLGVRIVASTIIAISGGALLIVPMVIMSFHSNRTKSLVTVSCSVLLFGFFLGVVIRSKSSEIFLATATYAAVLVVFVGTGTSGT